jgi:phage/plasmid-like protein (TIGR03299 family)
MTANFEAGFSVREVMWHGLGEVLADYPGREAAFAASGQDWTVERIPLGLLPVGTDVGELSDGSRIARGPVHVINDWEARVRSDTGVVLTVQRPSFVEVQNETVWDLVDGLVADPRVKYETAGVLGEGRCIWVLAKVEGDWRVGGDDSPFVPYLAVANWHDGTGSLRAMRTGVRIVCQNTLNLAITDSRRSGHEWTFRHTGSVLDRIEEARAAVDGLVTAADAFVDLGNELLAKKVSDAGRRLFLERFIPSPNEALVTDRALANIEAARMAVRSILDGDTGTVTPEQGATAYGLFEAGVEYLDHLRPARSQESRFRRALIEPGKEKVHVLALAREAAKV